MSDAAGAGGALPRWASPYLEQFRGIQHALALADGFVLVPVEVPSEDVAHALAAWLTAEGRPMTVIEPTTEEAWRGLTSALFEAKPGEDGGVMVIGRRGEPPGMVWGLGLLNQRRDSVGRQLRCPLLWCGPWAFQDATWRAAPDFWSVGDVPKRMEPPWRKSPCYPIEWTIGQLWGGGDVSGLVAYLDAMAQEELSILANESLLLQTYILLQAARCGFAAMKKWIPELFALLGSTPDVQTWAELPAIYANLWTLGLCPNQSARFLLAALEGALEKISDQRARAFIMLAKGEILASTGMPVQAQVCCEDALAMLLHVDDQIGVAPVRLVLAHALLSAGEADRAEAAYEAAAAGYRHFNFRRGEAHSLRGLGDLRLVSDRFTEARQIYEQSLSVYRDIGDRLGEANAQRSLGDLAALLDDTPAAGAAYREALRIYREIGVPSGERLAEERLAGLQPT